MLLQSRYHVVWPLREKIAHDMNEESPAIIADPDQRSLKFIESIYAVGGQGAIWWITRKANQAPIGNCKGHNGEGLSKDH